MDDKNSGTVTIFDGKAFVRELIQAVRPILKDAGLYVQNIVLEWESLNHWHMTLLVFDEKRDYNIKAYPQVAGRFPLQAECIQAIRLAIPTVNEIKNDLP
jgi:hypothetical protein